MIDSAKDENASLNFGKERTDSLHPESLVEMHRISSRACSLLMGSILMPSRKSRGGADRMPLVTQNCKNFSIGIHKSSAFSLWETVKFSLSSETREVNKVSKLLGMFWGFYTLYCFYLDKKIQPAREPQPSQLPALGRKAVALGRIHAIRNVYYLCS